MRSELCLPRSTADGAPRLPSSRRQRCPAGGESPREAQCTPRTPYRPGLVPSGFYEPLSALKSQGWPSPLGLWTHCPLCQKLSSPPTQSPTLPLTLAHSRCPIKSQTIHITFCGIPSSTALHPRGRERIPELCLKGRRHASTLHLHRAPSQAITTVYCFLLFTCLLGVGL